MCCTFKVATGRKKIFSLLNFELKPGPTDEIKSHLM
jgi:hypothetical protein